MFIFKELKALCCKAQIKFNRLEVLSAGRIPSGIVILKHATTHSCFRLACIGSAFGGGCLLVCQSRVRIRIGNASAGGAFFRKIVLLRIPRFLFLLFTKPEQPEVGAANAVVFCCVFCLGSPGPSRIFGRECHR
jgi:hypothetical protein